MEQESKQADKQSNRQPCRQADKQNINSAQLSTHRGVVISLQHSTTNISVHIQANK